MDHHPKMEFEGNYGCLVSSLSDDDDDSGGIKAELMGLEEENEFLRMVDPAIGVADSSLSLDDSDDVMNQTSDESYQWWDFWS